MKRSSYPALALLLVLVAAPGPATADQSAVRKELERLHQEMGRATRQSDLAALTSLVTPDFQGTDAYGRTRNHEQQVDAWKRAFKSTRTLICTHRIESLRRDGDEATVVVRGCVTFRGADAERASPPLEAKSLSRQTWRLTCEGWRLSADAELERQVRQGGKIVWPGETPEAAAVREQLQSLYDDDADALVRRDFDAVGAALPPEFQQVEVDGTPMTARQITAAYRETLAPAQCVICRFEIMGVTVDGPRAVVLRTLYLGTDTETTVGATRAVRVTTTARDTWTKTDAGWTIRRSEALVRQRVVEGEFGPPEIVNRQP